MLISITFLLYAFFSILEAKSGSISCSDGPEIAKIMNGWRKGKRNLFFPHEQYRNCTMIVTYFRLKVTTFVLGK